MAFVQLRRRNLAAEQAEQSETRRRREADSTDLISGSTKAIGRSYELLARTAKLPGMNEPQRKIRRV